jgi:hypothetical protein
VFGLVMIRLPRFRCAGCGGAEAGVGWPAHCRSRPEFDQLRAHLSALMPYRITAGLLEHLLPVDAGINSETLRRRDCFLRSTVLLLRAGDQVLLVSFFTPAYEVAAALTRSAFSPGSACAAP